MNLDYHRMRYIGLVLIKRLDLVLIVLLHEFAGQGIFLVSKLRKISLGDSVHGVMCKTFGLFSAEVGTW